MCAVYALFGVVLIPISFLAIRLSRSIIHPEVFTLNGPQMTHSQFLTFCVSLARDALPVRDALPDRARRQAARHCSCASCGSCSRDARPRSTPLPPTSSSSSALLAYVLIIASKLQRLQRQVGELVEKLREREPADAMAELLFWPALLGYGEAAIAYTLAPLHAARDLGRAARLARADRAARRAGGRASTAFRGRPGPARSTSSSGSSSAPT